MKRLKVNTDFLLFLEGDILTLEIDFNKIEIVVSGRTQDGKFYGNTKGVWSRENPRPLNSASYMWIKEPLLDFVSMTIKIPPRPYNLSTEYSYLYTLEEWLEIQLNKVVQTFKEYITEI